MKATKDISSIIYSFIRISLYFFALMHDDERRERKIAQRKRMKSKYIALEHLKGNTYFIFSHSLVFTCVFLCV